MKTEARSNLRYYQEDVVTDLQQTDDHVIVQMPTRSGKTRTICEYLSREGYTCVIVAHRQELLDNFAAELKYNHILEYELWTVNKLYRKIGTKDSPLRKAAGGILVVDEAHRIMSDSYQSIVDSAKALYMRVIGITATPIRGDGKPLGNIFDRIILGPSHKKLLSEGFLVPCSRVYSTPAPLNLAHIPVTGGDYQSRKAGAYCSSTKHRGLVADTWQKYNRNRRTLAFCCSVEHCNAMAAEFRGRGVPVEVVVGKTPMDRRRNYVDMFIKRDIKVLITCLVYTEGIDINEIECIIVDRPTRLLNLYMQMIGRGAGLAPAKRDFSLQDHCGLTWYFGKPLNDNVKWSLHNKPTVAEHRPVMCSYCGVLLDSDRVDEIRRTGGGMLCECCFKPVELKRKLSWNDRESGDLVLFSENSPINPCGYEWRTDIDDNKFKHFRSLMLPINPNQHRSDRRENILARAKIFKKRYFKPPQTSWFLPTCTKLTDYEVYACCLHVVSCLQKKRPEADWEGFLKRARSIYRLERGAGIPKHFDYLTVEKVFKESLLPVDLYEVG